MNKDVGSRCDRREDGWEGTRSDGGATGGGSISVHIEGNFTKVNGWPESMGATPERWEPQERGISGGVREGREAGGAGGGEMVQVRVVRVG